MNVVGIARTIKYNFIGEPETTHSPGEGGGGPGHVYPCHFSDPCLGLGVLLTDLRPKCLLFGKH